MPAAGFPEVQLWPKSLLDAVIVSRLNPDWSGVTVYVPHALVTLIWQNKRLLFKLLFEASAATLLEIAADPDALLRSAS